MVMTRIKAPLLLEEASGIPKDRYLNVKVTRGSRSVFCTRKGCRCGAKTSSPSLKITVDEDAVKAVDF